MTGFHLVSKLYDEDGVWSADPKEQLVTFLFDNKLDIWFKNVHLINAFFKDL